MFCTSLTRKLPDLDFQALTQAIMATKLSKMAKNWLCMARNRTALATRAAVRIVAFVFAMPTLKRPQLTIAMSIINMLLYSRLTSTRGMCSRELNRVYMIVRVVQ